MCLVSLIPAWPCVLLEHFRVQYAAGGLLIVAATAALRMRGCFDAAALATLFQLVWISPDLARSTRTLPSAGSRVRVLVLNVHTASSSFADVERLLHDEQPDVVALVEVSQRWLDALAPSLASYQGRLAEPRDDNFGVALYTRTALVGSIERVGGSLPSVFAETAIRGTPLGLVVHTLPPISGEALDSQRDQLDAVAARVRAMRPPVLVAGDLNAPPWSRPFHRFVAHSGLRDSRAGFGVQASFPAASALLRIPIDHVLVSCSIGVVDRRIARDVGSDHLPVVVDVVVP